MSILFVQYTKTSQLYSSIYRFAILKGPARLTRACTSFKQLRMNMTIRLLHTRARVPSIYTLLLRGCNRHGVHNGGTRWKQGRYLPTEVENFSRRYSGLQQRSFSSMRITTGPSCLDDPDVESFTIPGARVYERFFDCPLGELMKRWLRMYYSHALSFGLYRLQ